MGNRADRKTEGIQPLTNEQRRLVRENIGLVSVHLRRNVSNLAVPRRDREWEDLFQEGCLGLIRAAALFRKESGIPFAAFALPRIHNAVSRALQSKFSTIYVPPQRKRTAAGAMTVSDRTARLRSSPPACDMTSRQRHLLHTGGRTGDEPPKGSPGPPSRRGGNSPFGKERSIRHRHHPLVYSLTEEHSQRQADHPVHSLAADSNTEGDTISGRLRGKYDRAVRAAAKIMATGVSRRGDRDRLVRVLIEERFLVPHEESRTALRQIARQTQSSYARVAQCEKLLGKTIRRVLEADPEFRELRHAAGTHPDGTRSAVDADLERRLATASADEFMTRFRTVSPPDRCGMLDALRHASSCDIDQAIRDAVSTLSGPGRETLMQYVVCHGSAGTRCSPSKRL